MGRLYDTYLSTVSTGVRKEKGTAWERMDICGRWKDRRTISFMIYIYSCLYYLVGERPTRETSPLIPKSCSDRSRISVALVLAV